MTFQGLLKAITESKLFFRNGRSSEIAILSAFFVLSVGGFLQSSAQPHESAARPLEKGSHATSKGHTLLIPVAAMGKCKQANEFQLRHYGHPIIVYEQNR